MLSRGTGNAPGMGRSAFARIGDDKTMVGHLGHRAHTNHLSEFIQFVPSRKALDPAQVASLYRDQGFSASQVVEKIGCSKSLVIATLKRLGCLRVMAGSQTNPDNYRKAIAPYGQRVVDGNPGGKEAQRRS